ncbi:Cytochrome C' [Monaibacterium marinum]|uniref:Cytochrome C n=1 Tax=Pontivivens marinum TaxID=1690039 RepID=A0A2C9CNJ8_9RHOB|nr:cytochrome c [Monaibacterium marinum]SOH92894.1 Cytochrome C' [Monaibacterium marinum]
MRQYIIAITALCATTSTLAHAGATGIVLQRMESMKEMNEASKALALIRAGGLPFEPELLTRVTDLITNNADLIPAQYPDGSFAFPSEALLSIAQNRDDFEAAPPPWLIWPAVLPWHPI